MRRKDTAPDHFRLLRMGRPIECDGLTFLPVFAEDGSGRLDIFFQNRFSRPCRATIFVLPPRRSFSFGRLTMPRVEVDLEVGDAEFGVLHVPFDAPPALFGRTLTFDVAAKVTYPQRRGKAVRFRRGARVGPPQGAGSAVVSVLAACVGILYLSRPATARLTLPTQPAPPGRSIDPQHCTLWSPTVEMQTNSAMDVPGVPGLS
jgi:hypothetical protein